MRTDRNAIQGKPTAKKAAARSTRTVSPRRGGKPALRLVATGAVDTAQVYDRIWNAIIDHSLPPETRLIESDLCEIFGLGRTRMRQVLQRLAHERVVTLMRNRGAMVSRPSVQEAREVFAARRVIEAGVVATFITRFQARDIRRLRQHVDSEEKAWHAGNRRAMLKLSGEFHLLVAEVAGNPILTEMLRDLVSRSSLIIAVYQSRAAHPCPPDAHRDLTALLERRDPAAVQVMLQHLDHVIADLRLDEERDQALDLRAVLSGAR